MDGLTYLRADEDGCVWFDPYFEYLGTIREALPETVAGFALDEARYDLRGPKTLHDAWLVGLDISNGANKLKFKDLMLTLTLLHSAHESTIALQYSGVSKLELPQNVPHLMLSKNDILVHEFGLVRRKVLSHKISFADGSLIGVQFKNLTVSEQRIKP